MRNLTIHAASADSARAMASALSEFRVKVSGSNGHHDVVVTFKDGDGEIARVLSALARYATESAVGGPAATDASRV